MLGYLKLAGVLIVVGALTSWGAYEIGQAVGKAQCEATQLRETVKQAHVDADAHAAAEDTNTEVAVEDAKVEAQNDVVAVTIDKEIAALPDSGECLSVGFMREFNAIK